MIRLKHRKAKTPANEQKDPFSLAPSVLSKEFYNIPLLGEAHLAEKHEDAVSVHPADAIRNILKKDRQSITLRVMDDGMTGAGIFRGDFLTLDLGLKVSDNDIAAVQLGERIYIRRIFFEGKFIRLETDRPNTSPYIIDPKVPGFEIVGKVVTVVREL